MATPRDGPPAAGTLDRFPAAQLGVDATLRYALRASAIAYRLQFRGVADGLREQDAMPAFTACSNLGWVAVRAARRAAIPR